MYIQSGNAIALANYTQAITLDLRDFTTHMGIVDTYYLMLEFDTALQKIDYIIAIQDKHAFDGHMRNIEVVRERIMKAREGYEKLLREKRMRAIAISDWCYYSQLKGQTQTQLAHYF